MFNFGRRDCCKKHKYNPCKDNGHNNKDYGFDWNEDFGRGNKCCDNKFEHNHFDCGCKPPKPVCFEVFIKKEKCRKFDGCNSYPESYHDECKKEVKKVCCFFDDEKHYGGW